MANLRDQRSALAASVHQGVRDANSPRIDTTSRGIWLDGRATTIRYCLVCNDGTAGTYTPKNYDDRFHGPLLLRPALGNSYNIPAVKALEYVPSK